MKKNSTIWLITSLGLMLVLALSFYVFASRNQSVSAQDIDGIKCEREEKTNTHFHVYLSLQNGAENIAVPSGIGIDNENGCIYWLHTHDEDNLIHIESPVARKFTLGNFFNVWGKILNINQAGEIKSMPEKPLVIFINDEKYTGDPRDIELKSKTRITIGTDDTLKPVQFDFPPGS